MTTVLGFAGGIKSGKSTLSEAVALRLGVPRVSFGSYVRSVAIERGLGTERETLQALGESLINDDISSFCTRVLGQAQLWKPGQAIVVDGIRHELVIEVINKVTAPSQFRLIYVFTAQATRECRFQNADSAHQPLSLLERHSTEQDAVVLRQRADIEVDGDTAIDVCVARILTFVSSKP